MKTKDQITVRLAELRTQLKLTQELVKSKPAMLAAQVQLNRLQGNIGALEWVLREGN